MILPALGVGATLDGGIIDLEDAPHQRVSVIIVVAVLGRAMQQPLAQPLLGLEVPFQHSEQLRHAQRPLIENVILDRGERIRHRAQSHPLNIGGVVTRAAVVVVLSRGDAVVNEQREERTGHVLRVQALDHGIAAHFDVHKVLHLPGKSVEQRLHRLEIARIAGRRAQLHAAARIYAVV